MIAQYESGARKPKMETIKRIAAALEIDSELLYDDSDLLVRSREHIERLNNNLEKTLQNLSPEQCYSLLNALQLTVSCATRVDTSEEQSGHMQRLTSLINLFGEMILKSIDMKYSSLQAPNDYLVFLKDYEKAIKLIQEHKERLITLRLDELGKDSVLYKLINQ